jgi:hypothetical protein
MRLEFSWTLDIGWFDKLHDYVWPGDDDESD